MALDAKFLVRQHAGMGSFPGVNPGTLDYTTDDAHATVIAANYFNDAANRMVKGDVILARCAMSGTPQLRAYIVTDISAAGVVTIAQLVNS